MNNKEKLESIGIHYGEVMQRFLNNERLYLKFLRNFCVDSSFSLLLEAYEHKDAKEMEHIAHTLKGVCANLGLNEMSNLLMEMVIKLRQDNPVDDVEEELHEVMKLFDIVVFTMKDE